MILEASKEHDKDRVAVYRLLKTEYLKVKTAPNAKPLTDDAEIALIAKMVKERKDTERVYLDNCREDLAQKERTEYIILEELLPRAVSEEDMRTAVSEWIAANGGSIVQKQMGVCMKDMRAKFAGLTIDNALLSSIIKSNITA